MNRSLTLNRLILHLATVLIVGLTSLGCEFRRITINEPIHQHAVAFVIPAQTTMQEVIAKLGAPDEVTGSEERTVFRYKFRSTKSLRVNFGWILRVFSPVAPSMILGRGDSGLDVFQVTFNRQWIVQDFDFSRRSETTGFNFWPF